MKNLLIIVIFLSTYHVVTALEFDKNDHTFQSLRLQKRATNVKADIKTTQESHNRYLESIKTYNKQERDNVIRAKDCADLYNAGLRDSGIYIVHLRHAWLTDIKVTVYCDMETEGGGWTVFQRRGEFGNRHINFYLNWQQYSEGFGNLLEEFWLGNENIHRLSTQDHVNLRVELKDVQEESRYANYGIFEVGSYNDDYILAVGNYSGDAGDGLTMHSKQTFKTYDKDNTKNCTGQNKGAWWYSSTTCMQSNLNGEYMPGNTTVQGIQWIPWKGSVLKWTEMKMRPKNFIPKNK